MITIFNTKLSTIQQQDSMVEITFVKDDVHISPILYGITGSKLWDEFKLAFHFEDLIDLQKEGLQNESDEVKLESLKKKLKKKIEDGYWFQIQLSEIVDGAESLLLSNNNEIKELPSIGFGTTAEEAKKDALNRIKRKILFAYEKGRIEILGNVNHSAIPYHLSFDCINGRDLRKYLLISENNVQKDKTNESPLSESTKINVKSISENDELITLRMENSKLKNRIRELETKLQNMKSSILAVLQDI